MHYQLWFINNCSNISSTKYAEWILHPKLTGEAYYSYCYYYCSCCCWLGGRYGCWEWKQQLLINIHRRGREEKILVSSSALSLYSLSLSVDFSLLLTLFSFDFLLYLYHNIFSHFLFYFLFSYIFIPFLFFISIKWYIYYFSLSDWTFLLIHSYLLFLFVGFFFSSLLHSLFTSLSLSFFFLLPPIHSHYSPVISLCVTALLSWLQFF